MRALTLIETMLAVALLSMAVLGVTYATTAGHQHLMHSQQRLQAVRLAEHLLEEIAARPYAGQGGPARSTFHVDDYNLFEEEPGQITCFAGQLYESSSQAFARNATVTSQPMVLTQMGGTTLAGKQISVTVEHVTGLSITLHRFIPEPIAP